MHKMNDPILNNQSQDDTAAFLRGVLTPEVRFIGFGESHWWNNPHRHLVKHNLSVLAEGGYRYLALEVDSNYQADLEKFAAGDISCPELGQRLQEAGHYLDFYS